MNTPESLNRKALDAVSAGFLPEIKSIVDRAITAYATLCSMEEREQPSSGDVQPVNIPMVFVQGVLEARKNIRKISKRCASHNEDMIAGLEAVIAALQTPPMGASPAGDEG